MQNGDHQIKESDTKIIVPLYELSRKKYVNGSPVTIPRASRSYIYVLFLNTGLKKVKQLPYYVGYASDLNSEFADNGELSWHRELLNQPATVHVIASVPESMASTVAQSLALSLSRNGFILNNLQQDELDIESFHNLNRSGIIDYLNENTSSFPLVTFLSDFGKKALKVESWNKAQQGLIDLEETGMSSSLLTKLVLQKTYQSKSSKTLSLSLAGKYVPDSNSSVHVFKKDKGIESGEQLVAILSCIRGLHGDWYLAEDKEIVLDSPITFYLSDNLRLAKLRKSAIRPSVS